MTTPDQMPAGALTAARALADELADVAGDEAAVLEVIARAGRAQPDAEHAAALCVATLAFTFAHCVTDVTRTTTPTAQEA